MSSEPGPVNTNGEDTEIQRATPDEVFERYVEINHDQSTGTIQSKKSAWKQFTYWFEEEREGQWLSELGPYFAVNYGDWLRTCDDISQNLLSINSNLYRVKSVIKFAKLRGFVSRDVPQAWEFPDLDREDEVRDEWIETKRGVKIMHYVEQERTYTADHVLWILNFRYALRVSAIRAIDVEHVVFDPEGDNPPHIVLRDRPKLDDSGDGLPLKNTREEYGSRRIPMDPDTADVIAGYLRYERKDENDPDKFGFRGLLTSERSSRVSDRCIRTWVHALTSPVTYKGECDCSGCDTYLEKNGSYPPRSKLAKVCDRTLPPHPVRHGGITHMLNEEMEFDIIANIVGTKPQELRGTYDRRDEWQRLDQSAKHWPGMTGSAKDCRNDD